ncbi:MAG: DegT/DnrJ/EryC1/StrS family aminotransferase [Chloroflexi bacterium]|nr:DegT/DnrJ/EryC1/StrS family aminotransferase [Chloroflexota bacterium]
MKVPAAKIDFSEADRRQILSLIDQALATGQLTLGANVQRFERDFAKTAGVKYACAVSSGTSALEIALRAFGVEGKEVLAPTNTFFATAAAVVHAGGKPRFVDCEAKHLSMDAQSLKDRWTAKCAGVVVVHIGGAVTPGIDEIKKFCRSKGMFLLEDAAHAHGSTLNGKPAGSFGDAACFSFYPTKVMTSGEGGMLVTDSEQLHAEAVVYRDQGKSSFGANVHVRMGANWRMSEVHAAIGLVHLARLPEFIAARQRAARWYDEALAGVPDLKRAYLPKGSASNYYKYPVFLPNGLQRGDVKKIMREQFSVALSGEVYELPLHKQPVFAPYADAALPAAEQACARHICLPLFPSLTEDEALYVVGSLKQTLETLRTEVRH